MNFGGISCVYAGRGYIGVTIALSKTPIEIRGRTVRNTSQLNVPLSVPLMGHVCHNDTL
jgi:hypothetical protein